MAQWLKNQGVDASVSIQLLIYAYLMLVPMFSVACELLDSPPTSDSFANFVSGLTTGTPQLLAWIFTFGYLSKLWFRVVLGLLLSMICTLGAWRMGIHIAATSESVAFELYVPLAIAFTLVTAALIAPNLIERKNIISHSDLETKMPARSETSG
jgi:hypothetical protein